MVRMLKTVVLSALVTMALGAHAQSTATKAADGTWTDAKGMTLYVFDKDAGGKSVCNGPCAALWPPYMATGEAKAAGDWTVIARDDGAKQWSYKGKPLYGFSKDAKAGDKTGDNFNSVWHVAKD